MVQAVSSVEALPRRIITRSKTEPEQWRWRTDFIGEVKYGEIVPRPQVFLVEMRPGETILPHYHAVDQFQIFVAGSGSLVRNQAANPVTVHYVDHHTGYGPVSAGAQGLSYFALRPKTDSGPVYLHEPGYREKMKPGKKRHFNEQITLSTEPVLLSRGVKLVNSRPVGSDKSHLKLTVKDGLGTWSGIAFRQADSELAPEVDIVYSLQRDWRGEAVELEVLDIAPSGSHRGLEMGTRP